MSGRAELFEPWNGEDDYYRKLHLSTSAPIVSIVTVIIIVHILQKTIDDVFHHERGII